MVNGIFNNIMNSNFLGNNVPIECCSRDLSNAPPRYIHPACAPLKVQSNDRHIACLNYVRSAIGVDENCKFGPAQQVRFRFCFLTIFSPDLQFGLDFFFNR